MCLTAYLLKSTVKKPHVTRTVVSRVLPTASMRLPKANPSVLDELIAWSGMDSLPDRTVPDPRDHRSCGRTGEGHLEERGLEPAMRALAISVDVMY